MKVTMTVILLGLSACACAQSSLASLRTYERLRDVIFKAANSDGAKREKDLQRASEAQKVQAVRTGPFPCETAGARSPVRPQSVHRLRPGDIDVVGAMGDSLTASHGNFALGLAQSIVPNRGMSWTGGGERTWREYLTIPNILKEFNPKLVGYSYNDSLAHHRASQFNVAEGGAMSPDMPFQAKLLLRRMRSDPRVDLTNDWKLVSLMIGPNDFCQELCYTDSKQFPERHRSDLTKTLDFLQENLPRTLVNVVPTPHVELLLNFTGKPALCKIVNYFECPCMFRTRFRHRMKEFIAVMDRWREVQKEVVDSDRYKTTDDFAVVLQPFSSGIFIPTVDSAQGKITDYSYFSSDCFHFSQKSNAIASNALWNNMLEPVGQKSSQWFDLFSRFLCPSEKNPYIYTTKNSGV